MCVCWFFVVVFFFLLFFVVVFFFFLFFFLFCFFLYFFVGSLKAFWYFEHFIPLKLVIEVRSYAALQTTLLSYEDPE